jgi:hypothetical protein
VIQQYLLDSRSHPQDGPSLRGPPPGPGPRRCPLRGQNAAPPLRASVVIRNSSRFRSFAFSRSLLLCGICLLGGEQCHEGGVLE